MENHTVTKPFKVMRSIAGILLSGKSQFIGRYTFPFDKNTRTGPRLIKPNYIQE